MNSPATGRRLRGSDVTVIEKVRTLLAVVGIAVVAVAGVSFWRDHWLQDRQDKLESSLEKQGTRLDATEKRVTAHDDDLGKLRTDVDTERSRNDAQETRIAENERVSQKIEAEAERLRAELESTRAELAAQGLKSAEIETGLESLRARISVLETRAEEARRLEERVRALESERNDDRARLRRIEQVLGITGEERDVQPAEGTEQR